MALLVTLCPHANAEDTLGRLFFSAERRQQLDRQRTMNTLDKQPAMVAPTLTVDGIVMRSSGKRTAWVNGNPQHESERLSGLTVSARPSTPGAIRIESHDLPAAHARVGDAVNSQTGEASDLLAGGRIRVHRRSATP
ncbi:MAG TPA: hypothetical protein PLS67_00605 [Accumulibacter sp.]|nr:hypothetical protein [Accumulibacter sp.]HQC79001.1 hypothetical protein [Accumulibacter sp.]